MAGAQPDATSRPRARDIGIAPGVLPTGELNAISDVAGVLVGQVTIWEGDDVRTGVTTILPHSGNLFQEKVPAAIHLGNAYGKLIGYTQVRELGFIESPIVLTGTLAVWNAANGVLTYLMGVTRQRERELVQPHRGRDQRWDLERHPRPSRETTEGGAVMRHRDLSPLFQATIEATEEAIYNSLLKAVDVVGNGNRRDALPIDRVLEIKKKYNR